MASADNGTAIVGDLPGYGEDAYFDDDAAYADEQNYASPAQGGADYQEANDDDADFNDGIVAPVGHSIVTRQATTDRVANRTNARPASTHSTAYAPVNASHLQPASFGSDCGCSDGGCSGGCEMPMAMSMNDCGCSSSSCGGDCGSSRKICNLFDRSGSNAWGSFETLLWFTQSREITPLVTTSTAGTLPVLGLGGSNTQVAFGDELESDMQVGFRGDVGFWLSDNVGLGGRFWILDDATDDFSTVSDGTDRSVGRPFFNTSSGAVGDDAVLVSLDGVFRGSIEAESTLEMLAAEAYGRFRIGCAKNAQLDFIGGYSYFNIEDSLTINDRRFNTGVGGDNTVASSAVGINPLGTLRTFSDSFNLENEFHGGQLGFDLMINRGKWTAKSLTKVHLGNMTQSFQAAGFNTRTVPGGVTLTNPGGVLAGVNAIDDEDDVFTFAPEANFKLAYKFRPNVAFSVGYSFIYFDNVAQVGDNVGNMVSGNNIGSGIAGPNPGYDGTIRHSGLWVQGVDLGVVIDF